MICVGPFEYYPTPLHIVYQIRRADMEVTMQTFKTSLKNNQNDLQLTLEDDFNVPDAKPDVDVVIKLLGTVTIHKILPMNQKYLVKGALHFQMLYSSKEGRCPVQTMNGELPFEETVNIEGTLSKEEIFCQWDIEDIQASLINSRKVNVSAVVCFHLFTLNQAEETVVSEIEEDLELPGKKKNMTVLQLFASKMDTLRIKDEVSLPLGKENAGELLYSDLRFMERDEKIQADTISIRGIVRTFVLYLTDGEDKRLAYYEVDLPVNGTLSVPGLCEGMILEIDVNLTNPDIQFKEDADGENRILDVEAVLQCDIKAYEEEDREVLEDVYSTRSKLMVQRKRMTYPTLLLKNSSKVRVMESIPIKSGSPPILQICNGDAVIRVEEQKIVENGIVIEGNLGVQILYLTEEDDRPLAIGRGDIPFSQIMEVKGISPKSRYELRSYLDQLSIVPISEREAEVRATICLEALVFDEQEADVILSLEEAGGLIEERAKLPGITGYIVGAGDSLWDIAKKFYTTMESIAELNALETDTLQEGQKLVICK
ncbi:MAG: hypothetical protein PWP24_554 [Clostridiales bacterium]|nr:hypothetical protein [Clostridiales bacterium]